MRKLARNAGWVLIILLTAACSSTTISGSWSDPEFTRQIKKLYVVGIAKDETTRRIFEDAFSGHLASKGVTTFSSYKDLPNSEEATREDIFKRMTAEGCDSVLMTKLIGKRQETVTTPGRISAYSSAPYYGGRGGYYNSWGSYYGTRTEVVYQPPTSTDFTILTIESVLYDLATEKMIWSGQLETVVEGNLEKMVEDFVKEVSEDMTAKGIL